MDANKTTHLPGQPVNIRGRVIQRCAVCGLRLRDSVKHLKSDDEFIFFRPFIFVEFDGDPLEGQTTFDHIYPPDNLSDEEQWLPDNICFLQGAVEA